MKSQRKAVACFISTFLLFFIGISVLAQTPVRIHDLRSLTDSTGNDHLFYRIYTEYEGADYNTDHIYYYNVATGEETLFLEDFYDARFGSLFSQSIKDYAFFENDPENYVYITSYCDNECSQTISRPDSADIFGGLFVTIKNLNVEGTDTGRVYVEAYGETIIGRNGGRDWPEVNEGTSEIPDSSVLGFPLVSLSPYNDSLMFGRRYFFSDGENALLKSRSRGKESEVISDTLLPTKVHFDADRQTTYLIDRVNAPGNQCTFETCKYAAYRSQNTGEIENWEAIYISEIEVKLYTHSVNSGEVYLWFSNQIFVSSDYGENFESLIEPIEVLTGFTATANSEYYSTTTRIYSLNDGVEMEIKSIPVFREWETEVPEFTELYQNYPNPFNPTTNIRYSIPDRSEVSLKIYDLLGREVAVLVNEVKESGEYSINFDASSLSSGVYIYQVSFSGQIFTKRMTLIK